MTDDVFNWADATPKERERMIAELTREGENIAASMSTELTEGLQSVGIPYRWVMTFNLVPVGGNGP
jgi:hypothetical protein